MALRTYQVTLGSGATQLDSTRHGVRQIIFSSGAHDYFVGKSNVDSTHGVKVPVPAANVPYTLMSVGPFSGDEPCYTNEFYLSGTQNDVIQVIVVTG